MDCRFEFWHDSALMQSSTFFDNLDVHFQAILEREFRRGNHRLQFVGSASASLVGLFLANISSKDIENLPHLVITSSLQDAEKFQQAIEFFDSTRNVYLLSSFDVSPYSGLEPKPQIITDRLKFLFYAQNAKVRDIFVAPITALLQKSIPFKDLTKHHFRIQKDFEISLDFQQQLSEMGYQSSPVVEDVGQYAIRGGIFDIFSPAHDQPVRIELFGDVVESLRNFSIQDQRSSGEVFSYDVIPCKETVFSDDHLEKVLKDFRSSLKDRETDKEETDEILRSLSRKQFFPGIDYLLPYFYESLQNPLEHFSTGLNIWMVDSLSINREADQFFVDLQTDFQDCTHPIRPAIKALFQKNETLEWPQDSRFLSFSNLVTENFAEKDDSSSSQFTYSTHAVLELANPLQAQTPGNEEWQNILKNKLNSWKKDSYRILVTVKNKSQAERLKLLLEKFDWHAHILGSDQQNWQEIIDSSVDPQSLTIVQRYFPESLRIPDEKLIFLRDEDLLGRKTHSKDRRKSSTEFQEKAKRLSFGDLNPGDCVVHVQHGIGVYEGLKLMNIGGAESEFIQIAYKDKDRLYLPVYRVGQLQRYSGAAQTTVLDKLGGPGWEKTKTKVKKHLRDIAGDLLEIYAKRAQLERPAFHFSENDLAAFEAAFPYDETDDQLRSIEDIVKDMTSTRPMDRLICGDVGFGKTEVAMRAAFIAVQSGKQVAILAPTTVLSFQHFETFKKRFHGWPVEIRELNRFVSNADAKKTISELKEGKVDIIIGTHRILSKDVEFNNLGLMIVDEEQKFGVLHKERIKKLKNSIDTLTLSATPIPRTLNMSLMGVRDLSIINTAPVDRLPTRTFISKFDEANIRKSIEAEIARGGQVYFIHNRVQSIYALADELRQIVPDARIRVGHGQMNEDELEKTMVAFFNHEIDVLICTTIVESGMDIPRANTMFIDQAHMMGLSQLYQLRGRVGRSKQRAYCYLILPRDKKLDKDAQERLKVLQENTALGSGIRIAQYDLELRGSGNLLGEEQSGHVNSVGYEMYMDLLNETIHQLKGEPTEALELDPEINLRIPALIPDNYIKDIRIRLSYYKALADIRSHEDIEKIEEELKDQFGELPDATLNLMGLMLIRSICRELGVQDVSAGAKNVSLKFSPQTRMKPETVISLAMRENKKYSITPDNRLNIRMNSITWPAVFEELQYLKTLI